MTSRASSVLHCNAPNLSFVMNQLTNRGLAERSADPADRRSRVVALTEEGRRVRETVIGATLALTPFTRLSPGELTSLVHPLGKALAPMTAEAGGGDLEGVERMPDPQEALDPHTA